jgi:hypothetical protein
MSAYYAAPGTDPAATGQEQLAPVLVAFAGPAPQSRLTVLIRILMVIPHLIVLWALAIAAYVVVIIGWFGALFTGQLPGFAADYLSGFLRWQTRVFGYTILLTDVYPPFTLEDADYPIRVAVRPSRLNRLAVLFRFFLLIPAYLVQTVVAYGAFTLVAFVTWLIVLITGRMPDALHAAYSAVLRYQTRVLGFAFMLTSAYPSGLYGDPAPAPGFGFQPGAGAPQPEYGTPQPEYGTPQAEYGRPFAAGGQAGYGNEPDGLPRYAGPTEHGPVPVAGTSWWVVLSGAAKTLVTVFIVLGVLFAIGQGVFQATVTGKAVTTVQARNQLQADASPLNSVLSSYDTHVNSCQTVACAAPYNREVANAFSTFASQVRGIAMPTSQARTDAATLASDASHVASIYNELATASSLSQYQSISSSAQSAVSAVNGAYNTLGVDLGAS